jgi:hypothetical protein
LKRLHLDVRRKTSYDVSGAWLPTTFGKHLEDFTLQYDTLNLPRAVDWELLVTVLRRSPKLKCICLRDFWFCNLTGLRHVLSHIKRMETLEVFEVQCAKVWDSSLCLKDGCEKGCYDMVDCRDWKTKDARREVEDWMLWAHLHQEPGHAI